MKVGTRNGGDAYSHKVRTKNSHTGVGQCFVKLYGKLIRSLAKTKAGGNIVGVFHDPFGLQCLRFRIQ